MEIEEVAERHRSCLSPGTVVAEWRLLGCHGHGANGVVYRAVRVGHEAAGLVALKLALLPWDPRFMRELALLSLVRHPSVPRLLGHGFWKHPCGSIHPFVVMEWIDGTPLYEWARVHHPTSRQVFQVLSQLASALQAIHASSAVHRDVKGDNILVRRSDGRAMLTDFGTGLYRAVARVTWQPLPPGTPAYQSPEAGLFQLRSVRSRDARYLAGPADDMYALGVTAYRLVTGEYPPSPEPELAEDGSWHMKETPPPDPRELNPQVDPQLSAWILRMLSLSPEARGTAGELAQALEAAMEHEGADEAPAAVPALAERAGARAWRPVWRPGLVVALAGVLLSFWSGLAVHAWLEGAPSEESLAVEAGEPDVRPADLGDLAPAVSLAPVQEPSKPKKISQGQPPKPIPGQLRTDSKGRCPSRKQVPINGGCWVEVPATDAEECGQNGHGFYQGRCYAPAIDTRKPQPTSDPPP